MVIDQIAEAIGNHITSQPYQIRAGEDGREIVFLSPCEEVGELIVSAKNGEITVWFPNFTHLHWGKERKAEPSETSVQAVLDFVINVLTDRVELYGNSRGGGGRQLPAKPRGRLSRVLYGKQSYVWSGTLSPHA